VRKEESKKGSDSRSGGPGGACAWNARNLSFSVSPTICERERSWTEGPCGDGERSPGPELVEGPGTIGYFTGLIEIIIG